jgi:hypothetical protein
MKTNVRSMTSKNQKSFTFSISNSNRCIYVFHKRFVSWAHWLLRNLGVIEKEYEMWDNFAEGYAEDYEDLVEEEDVLIRNTARK